jgi:hypothetical protein
MIALSHPVRRIALQICSEGASNKVDSDRPFLSSWLHALPPEAMKGVKTETQIADAISPGVAHQTTTSWSLYSATARGVMLALRKAEPERWYPRKPGFALAVLSFFLPHLLHISSETFPGGIGHEADEDCFFNGGVSTPRATNRCSCSE